MSSNSSWYVEKLTLGVWSTSATQRMPMLPDAWQQLLCGAGSILSSKQEHLTLLEARFRCQKWLEGIDRYTSTSRSWTTFGAIWRMWNHVNVKLWSLWKLSINWQRTQIPGFCPLIEPKTDDFSNRNLLFGVHVQLPSWPCRQCGKWQSALSWCCLAARDAGEPLHSITSWNGCISLRMSSCGRALTLGQLGISASHTEPLRK